MGVVLAVAFVGGTIYLLLTRLDWHWGMRLPTRRLPPANSISNDERLIPLRNRPQTRGREGNGMSNDGIFSRIVKAITGEPAAPAQSPMPAAPAIAPVEVDYEDTRVPATARDKVRRILACLKEVEELVAREPMASFSRVDIEQMRGQHLPKLVKSYIDIPPSHRPEIFRKTGKSASYILEESLDQMQAKVDAIMRNLAQHDIDAFTDNTRFIKERYDDTNPFD